ncbi:hypothetical protein BJX64DRAFT_47767 [Aspergillus heterothallicus]
MADSQVLNYASLLLSERKSPSYCLLHLFCLELLLHLQVHPSSSSSPSAYSTSVHCPGPDIPPPSHVIPSSLISLHGMATVSESSRCRRRRVGNEYVEQGTYQAKLVWTATGMTYHMTFFVSL